MNTSTPRNPNSTLKTILAALAILGRRPQPPAPSFKPLGVAIHRAQHQNRAIEAQQKNQVNPVSNHPAPAVSCPASFPTDLPTSYEGGRSTPPVARNQAPETRVPPPHNLTRPKI